MSVANEPTFSSILVLIDLAPSTPKVLAAALRLARCTGARLCLLHVEPPEPDFVGYRAGPQTVRDSLADEWRDEHRRLQELGDRVRAEGIEVLTLQIRKPLAEAVVTEARSRGADLVVAGFSRHGLLHRLIHGDTVHEIADPLACPILLVPEDASVS